MKTSEAMPCSCGARTIVTDSRPHQAGIRRTRACSVNCGAPRFTTLETRAERVPNGQKHGGPRHRVSSDKESELRAFVQAAYDLLGGALQ